MYKEYGKYFDNRTLEKPRRRRLDTVKAKLKGTGSDHVDYI
jgi:hypothetical protein